MRVALLCLVLACSGQPPAPPRPVPIGPGGGILFVGNSLTYANQLPAIVESLTAATGTRVPTASVAFPNYALIDHLQQGDALRSIASGGWRAVVLQQGPSGQDDSREQLRRWTAAFDIHIRAAGAATALFSVWPAAAGPSTFAQVAQSYSLAARDVEGIYLPVTQAWNIAWARDPSLKLYADDDYHPSAEGSYLSALVIAGVFTGADPVGMPNVVPRPDWPDLEIDAAHAAVLQDAAAVAISRYARTP